MFFRLFDKKSENRLTDEKFDSIVKAKLFCKHNLQNKDEHTILIVAYNEDGYYIDECSLWCIKQVN